VSIGKWTAASRAPSHKTPPATRCANNRQPSLGAHPASPCTAVGRLSECNSGAPSDCCSSAGAMFRFTFKAMDVKASDDEPSCLHGQSALS
jgi:hypothetical protein